MTNSTSIMVVIIFLPLLIFGTHYVRTWAFNRHEAITFESSSIAALLSLIFIWQYGASVNTVLLFALLMVMFAANAFIQWHFYMVLQDRIRTAFKKRADYLQKYGFDSFVNDILLTMASVAIMPSFSRFIEESRFFNNPGSFIGLIKSIMKRQRFQKKKYLMRECFAENVNLIGPCKPEIDNMMLDEVHIVPGAIHADDLALEYGDEKKGLISFDVLGMGAHIIVFAILLYYYLHPGVTTFYLESFSWGVLCMIISALAFTFISHILRHFGFARYESFSYELAFTGLVIASYRLYSLYMSGSGITAVHYIVFLMYVIVFIILSYENRKLDKTLHAKINELYTESRNTDKGGEVEKGIIYNIPLETETDRTKRRFLTNLKTISEWTIVPFPGSPRRSELMRKFMVTEKFKEFEQINQKKMDMPIITEQLVDKIVPEFSGRVTADNFRLPEATLKKARILNNTLSIVSFVAIFILIGCGIM